MAKNKKIIKYNDFLDETVVIKVKNGKYPYCCINLCKDWKALFSKEGELMEFEIENGANHFPKEVLSLLKLIN